MIAVNVVNAISVRAIAENPVSVSALDIHGATINGGVVMANRMLPTNTEAMPAFKVTRLLHPQEAYKYEIKVHSSKAKISQQRPFMHRCFFYALPHPAVLLFFERVNKERAAQIHIPDSYHSPIDFDHAIGADFNQYHIPTGGHSLLRGDVRVIPGTESLPDHTGVYRAKVEMKHPKSGQWIQKFSNHSMFPKAWCAERIQYEVNYGWRHKVLAPFLSATGKWQGVTPSGVLVEGFIVPKITVYPVMVERPLKISGPYF